MAGSTPSACAGIPPLRQLVAVGVAGAVGAVLRWSLVDASSALLPGAANANTWGLQAHSLGVRIAEWVFSPSHVCLLAVNALGALILGVLAAYVEINPGSPHAKHVYAIAGTGLLGGFTSYSAMAAVDAGITGPLPVGLPPSAGLGTVLVVLYAGLSVAAGVLAARAGWRLGERI